MALLPKNHLSPYQIHRDFVYKAKLANLIPVYLGDINHEEGRPSICEVNGCPRAFLHMALFLLGWTAIVMDNLNIPVAGYPIVITARLDGEPLDRDQALDQHDSEHM